jgi:hypothetical protein
VLQDDDVPKELLITGIDCELVLMANMIRFSLAYHDFPLSLVDLGIVLHGC